jgi:hypothetical protein
MLPLIEEKIKRAGPEALPDVTTKSLVPFATVPVGSPPGIVIDGIPGCLKKTMLPTSPRYSEDVLVPLLANQNGLVAVNVMPHGLTSSGSSMRANPGISDVRLVCL